MILLDFIEALPVDDAAQMHAREWASRVRELRKRWDELLQKANALLAAGDVDGCGAALDEGDDVYAELSKLCHRQRDVLSRLHPETMQ